VLRAGELRRLVSPSVAAEPLTGPRRRFVLLDASRALAALAVLFWHYQHFYYPIGSFGLAEPIDDRQPLHAVFALFYDHGHDAVAIFWMISGFVFSAVYLPYQSSTPSFAANRFARLYPLHALTLFVVAGLQAVALSRFGTPLIYANNDFYHFGLNLLFVSAWGWERGFSFNAPIWSVSVELLVYVLFWIVRRRIGGLGMVLPAALSIFFFVLSKLHPSLVVLPCGQYFFLGVTLYIVYSALHRQTAFLHTLIASALVIGLAGLWRDIMIVGISGFFGGLMLLLVHLDASVPTRLERVLGGAGDTTYGLYLWHIPVQLVLLLLFAGRGDMASTASAPWFLLLFLSSVTGIAIASFHWFERPTREWLRRLGSPARSPDTPGGQG